MNNNLSWRQQLHRLRLLRQDQTFIRKHRALYKLHLKRGNLLIALLLPIAFNIVLFLSIDPLLMFWKELLHYWLAKLDFGANVVMHPFNLGYVDLWIPAVAIEGQLPSSITWWCTALACVILFMASYWIRPNSGLPLIYMLRALVLIQVTALLYFAFIPASFPHSLADYVANNLLIGVMLIALIPWMLAVTYYLFDFSLIKKVVLTCLILSFFVLALPLQYLLHANLIAHGSLLFMPVLYLVFGLFIDVMAFIALYSYGMTWHGPVNKAAYS